MQKIWGISFLVIILTVSIAVYIIKVDDKKQHKIRYFDGQYYSVKEIEVNKGGATVGFKYEYYQVADRKDSDGKPFLITNSPVDSLHITGLIIRIKTSGKIYNFRNFLWSKQLKQAITIELEAKNQ